MTIPPRSESLKWCQPFNYLVIYLFRENLSFDLSPTQCNFTAACNSIFNGTGVGESALQSNYVSDKDYTEFMVSCETMMYNTDPDRAQPALVDSRQL